MIMQNLSEKYRPRTFDEFRGNDKVIDGLKQNLCNLAGKCLLFYGQSGVGKTTLARIIAHNLGRHYTEEITGQDVSVDWIRNIRAELSHYTLDDSCRIVIIDEVQQVPAVAKDALKTLLENVRGHNIIIATTTADPDKIFDPALKNRFAVRLKITAPSQAELESFISDVSVKEGKPLNGKCKTFARTAKDCKGNYREAIQSVEMAGMLLL